LFTLYQHFFEKKIIIYYEEKRKCDPTNKHIKADIERAKIQILNDYAIFAVQKVLKSDVKNHFPSFNTEVLDKDKLEILKTVGLVYEVNGKMRFEHQTYLEFCFNKFLADHFDKEDCSKFIVEVVLVDDSYKIIRLFINCWILEKTDKKKVTDEATLKSDENSEKLFNMYTKKLLVSTKKEQETPLNVAAREGNKNIFWFLYSSLTKQTDFK
jgi:hypothetical protein